MKKTIPPYLHMFWAGNAPLPRWAENSAFFWNQQGKDYRVFLHKPEHLPQTWQVLWCLENGKYSVLSDLCRHWAILMYGGYYIDTDIELIHNLHEKVNGFDFVAGLERPQYINCALCGGTPDNIYSKRLMHAWYNVDLKGHVPNPYPLESEVGPVLQTKVLPTLIDVELSSEYIQANGYRDGHVCLLPETQAFGVGYQAWAKGRKHPGHDALAMHYWSNSGR